MMKIVMRHIERTYHVDEHPSDTYPEDDKNIKDKIVDKLKKD